MLAGIWPHRDIPILRPSGFWQPDGLLVRGRGRTGCIQRPMV